jgi:hypothetical protein
VDGTGAVVCPMADFGIGSVKCSGLLSLCNAFVLPFDNVTLIYTWFSLDSLLDQLVHDCKLILLFNIPLI